MIFHVNVTKYVGFGSEPGNGEKPDSDGIHAVSTVIQLLKSYKSVLQPSN